MTRNLNINNLSSENLKRTCRSLQQIKKKRHVVSMSSQYIYVPCNFQNKSLTLYNYHPICDTECSFLLVEIWNNQLAMWICILNGWLKKQFEFMRLRTPSPSHHHHHQVQGRALLNSFNSNLIFFSNLSSMQTLFEYYFNESISTPPYGCLRDGATLTKP